MMSKHIRYFSHVKNIYTSYILDGVLVLHLGASIDT
nr:MAG TPA: glycoprotein [Caudoviricetes sp.]